MDKLKPVWEQLKKVSRKAFDLFLRLSIKWKIFAFSALLLVVALFIIGPREVKIYHDDKVTFIKDLNGRLSHSTARSVLNRIDALQDKLVLFTSYRESLSHTAAKIEDQTNVLFSQEQEFLAVGLVKVDEKGSNTVAWSLKNPLNISAGLWPQEFEKNTLEKISFSTTKGLGRGLWSLKGPNGNSYFVLALRVEIAQGANANAADAHSKTWVAGIVPETVFDDLFLDFATGVNKAYVLDENGLIVTASDLSVRQKNFKSESLFADALKPNKNGATAEYKYDGRTVVGSFDAVDKTNWVVLVTMPEDKAFEAGNSMMRTVYYVCGSLIIIALGISILFSNLFVTGPLNKLTKIINEMAQGRFNLSPDVFNKDEIGALATSLKSVEGGLRQFEKSVEEKQAETSQTDKMEAFTQLSSGVAQEIKNPMAGILGQIQLALKTAEGDTKNFLEAAEKEVRRVKTMIENLAKLGKVEKSNPRLTNLAQVAQDAINLTDHQLNMANCRLYKDFRPCPMVNVDPRQLEQVLVNLINNAIQATETTSEKAITVRVFELSGKARVCVEDSGIGIPDHVKRRIFEPFFTTKKPGKGMGLSLAVSKGLVDGNGGQLEFHNGDRGGTVFQMDFEIPAQRTMPSKEIVNAFGGQTSAKAPEAPLEKLMPRPAEKFQEVSIQEALHRPVIEEEKEEPTQAVFTPNDMPTTIQAIPQVRAERPSTNPVPAPFEDFVAIGDLVSETVSPSPTPAMKSIDEAPMNMPPVPEEAEYLDTIRTKIMPVPAAGLPTALPKRPREAEGHQPAPAPSFETEAKRIIPAQTAQPTIRNVSEFKVTIRRPKLRS